MTKTEIKTIKDIKTFLSNKGIVATQFNLRDWQSVENPNWKERVLDIYLEDTPSIIALELWDELLDRFRHLSINVIWR
jgi:hypothetical protein